MKRKIYSVVKRLLDIVFSLILIILTFPLMLLVMIILYINLGRPIFNEKRLREGLNKKPYVMYKLRTKKIDCDHLPHRERYTKLSYVIDKSHLNELPQFFNVLKGDMSFVGPRPFIPGEKLPAGKISKERYMVRPGMTCLAQLYGGIYLTHKEKLMYDKIYYDNFGFWQDFKIIILTPITICKKDLLLAKKNI